MFTGIIEATGTITETTVSGSNRVIWIESPLSPGFKVDQSVCHDGVCLTVEEIKNGAHRVTAIEETLKKTSLGSWQPGRKVNLERSLRPDSRLDGHFVQGHVDCTGTCLEIVQKDGSREITFGFPSSFAALVIEKGSICVNGVSLTVFNLSVDRFTIALIPYTLEHTNIGDLKTGDSINLEFDILGKYIDRRLSLK